MKKFIIAAFLALSLSACSLTPQGDSARTYAQTKGAEVADAGLENTVWLMCKGSTVGSVIRRFGVSDELWDHWKGICLTSTDLKTPAPEATEVTPEAGS